MNELYVIGHNKIQGGEKMVIENSDGSEFIQLKTLREDVGGKKSETQNKKSKFNWNLPLFGAIGFGVGFAIMCAINLTLINLNANFLAAPYSVIKIYPIVGVIRGLIVGAIGGTALGLGFKNKNKTLYLSCACAIGFAIGFALVIYTGQDIVISIGRAIMGHIGYESHSYLGFNIAEGLGTGVIVGTFGGFVLGLVLKKNKIVSALFLSITSAFGFSIAFAIGFAAYTGNLCSIWDGIGGAIGGAILGLTLALYNKIGGKDIISTPKQESFSKSDIDEGQL